MGGTAKKGRLNDYSHIIPQVQAETCVKNKMKADDNPKTK